MTENSKKYSGKYEFLNHRFSEDYVRWNNHDGDNRFLLSDDLNMVDAWQEDHEGCTLLGVVNVENCHTSHKGYYPVIYSDENENYYWTHFPIDFIKEALEANDAGKNC